MIHEEKVIVFFGVPLRSVQGVLVPIVKNLALSGHKIINYNMSNFEIEGDNIINKHFPSLDDYLFKSIDEEISYYRYSIGLLEFADQLADFLKSEVYRVQPGLVLHSHLAVWGKLIAERFNIPSVSLFSTFYFEKEMFVTKTIRKQASNNFIDAINLLAKAKDLFEKFGLRRDPNIWDFLANREKLNILFILDIFQEERRTLDKSFRYVGFPTKKNLLPQKEQLIYVSFGTIFNKSANALNICIKTLSKLPFSSIVVSGNISTSDLEESSNVSITQFANQISILGRAKLFISRGGMASVHESIYNLTPLIIIPITVEQKVIGRIVEKYGLGICILENLTKKRLESAILTILDNISQYENNLRSIMKNVRSSNSERDALALIEEYLVTSSFGDE